MGGYLCSYKTTMIMSRFAIYARVSTIDNKQDYTRQVDELRDIIIKEGHSPDKIDVYAESISGYKKAIERPKLTELILKTEENPKEYSGIYTSEISRIGRDPNHTRQVIDRWTELGIPLFIQSLKERTIYDNGKRNPIMNIILQVLMEYASIEAETFKVRSKSGLRASASKGKAGGGRNFAYGYKKDDKGYLVIDDEEAKVITKIFDLYIEGNGTKVISGILNQMEVPTRANKAYSNKGIKFPNFTKLGSNVRWSDKQVIDILSNTIYKGERKFKGEIFNSPVIISSDKFDQCTSIRSLKTHRNYLTQYVYLLKDLMVCGHCGRNYFAKYKPVVRGDKVYICSSRLKPNGNCGNVGVNITLIESAIFKVIFDNDTILKYINDSDKIVLNLKNEIEQLTQKLPIEETTLSELNDSQKRLMDLRVNYGGISEEDFIQRHQNTLQKIQNSIDRISLIKAQLIDKRASLK
jgi:DNA invertase Pin-like site-specific DNA recombinase